MTTLIHTRQLIGAVTLGAIATLGLGACAEARTKGSSTVMTSNAQKSMTPDDALRALKQGNKRFANGNSTQFDWKAQAKSTAANGQYPHSIVLSCLDSRVPVEAVFDQGIGDVFVGRVAGNFENTDMLGSFEFGTAVAGSKLIVVLGHSACGAVKGTIDQAELGNLTDTLANIEPAVGDVRVGSMGRTSKDNDLVDRVVEANVRRTVRDITDRSEVLEELVRKGDLKVVGAVYDLESGRVTWLD